MRKTLIALAIVIPFIQRRRLKRLARAMAEAFG
jgi:hypothetical protein